MITSIIPHLVSRGVRVGVPTGLGNALAQQLTTSATRGTTLLLLQLEMYNNFLFLPKTRYNDLGEDPLTPKVRQYNIIHHLQYATDRDSISSTTTLSHYGLDARLVGLLASCKDRSKSSKAQDFWTWRRSTWND